MHAVTNIFDHTRHFIAHHTRLRWPVGVETLPMKNVGKIQAGGFDANQNLVRSGNRIGPLFNLHNPSVAVSGGYDCTHKLQSSIDFSGNNILDESGASSDDGDSSIYANLAEHFAMLSPNGEWQDQPMAALFIALDESESKGEEYPAVSVGGFIATGLQWLNYAKAWNGNLELEGIDIFHSTDFATGVAREQHPVYKDWDLTKRESFLNSLIQIINSNLYRDVGIGVTRKVFNDVMTPARQARWGEIEYFTAMLAMIDAIGYSLRHFGVAPSIIVEKGAPYEAKLKTAYDKLCAMPEFEELLRLTTFNPQSKSRQFPQTQAADLLVFNASKGISHLLDFDIHPYTGPRIIEGKQIRQMRYPLQRFYDSFGNLKFAKLKREDLEGVVTLLEENLEP